MFCCDAFGASPEGACLEGTRGSCKECQGIEHLFDRQLTTMPTKVASDSGLGNLFPYCMDNLG
jgi:hypothetical protein